MAFNNVSGADINGNSFPDLRYANQLEFGEQNRSFNHKLVGTLKYGYNIQVDNVLRTNPDDTLFHTGWYTAEQRNGSRNNS